MAAFLMLLRRYRSKLDRGESEFSQVCPSKGAPEFERGNLIGSSACNDGPELQRQLVAAMATLAGRRRRRRRRPVALPARIADLPSKRYVTRAATDVVQSIPRRSHDDHRAAVSVHRSLGRVISSTASFEITPKGRGRKRAHGATIGCALQAHSGPRRNPGRLAASRVVGVVGAHL